MIILILALFATLALIGMAGIAMVNVFAYPNLGYSNRGQQHRLAEQPLVSILIPARNEAAVIGHTIRSLTTQTYLNYELILLDDNSTDETAAIALEAGAGSPKLRIISGKPLPAGWLGKNWACHQLAQAAAGDFLIFTDADVTWVPNALSALVAEMTATNADLLTIWPTQKSVTWGERLTVPLMALVVLGYLPLPLVHHTPWPMFAAANGQCMAFRRRAYEKIKGHTTVRSEVLEDVTLSRYLKANGLRLRMADGAGLITCRMYQNWADVRSGYAKNILAGYGGRVSFLGLATLFHWVVFLLPWLWLALGWLTPAIAGWPVWPLVLVGLGAGVRALTAAATGQRLLDALLMPISVLLMTRIAAQAIWWHYHGGPRWKGRVIKRTPAGGVHGKYYL